MRACPLARAFGWREAHRWGWGTAQAPTTEKWLNRCQRDAPHLLAPGARVFHGHPRIELPVALPEAANRTLAPIQGFLVCSTATCGLVMSGPGGPVALCFISFRAVTVAQCQILKTGISASRW